MPGTIALLTDFGLRDSYVGVMKAVMLGIGADLRLVDLSHAIPPQNIRVGAFCLRNSCRYFPPGTVFCVVVDPGVGSARLPIAAQAGDYRFIAPDNGVLSYALDDIGGETKAVSLSNPRFQLDEVSHTFHGRDIFAPAAAHLALDASCFGDMGEPLADIARLPAPALSFARQRLSGEVMNIDRFGNIITSIGVLRWQEKRQLRLRAAWPGAAPDMTFAAADAHITIHSQTVHGISRAYHEAGAGAILAQVDSSGFLEIGANQDDAAARLDVKLGDKVMVRLSG